MPSGRRGMASLTPDPQVRIVAWGLRLRVSVTSTWLDRVDAPLKSAWSFSCLDLKPLSFRRS